MTAAQFCFQIMQNNEAKAKKSEGDSTDNWDKRCLNVKWLINVQTDVLDQNLTPPVKYGNFMRHNRNTKNAIFSIQIKFPGA